MAHAAGASPLMKPCALHHAAEGKVDHFPGKTVLDAPAAFAGIHEFPLLPWMTCVIPQTDRSAVLRVKFFTSSTFPLGALMR